MTFIDYDPAEADAPSGIQNWWLQAAIPTWSLTRFKSAFNKRGMGKFTDENRAWAERDVEESLYVMRIICACVAECVGGYPGRGDWMPSSPPDSGSPYMAGREINRAELAGILESPTEESVKSVIQSLIPEFRGRVLASIVEMNEGVEGAYDQDGTFKSWVRRHIDTLPRVRRTSSPASNPTAPPPAPVQDAPAPDAPVANPPSAPRKKRRSFLGLGG